MTKPKPTLKDVFAVQVKALRLDRQLSQEALAEKAKLSVSYISMLEHGRREPPLSTVEQIAKALRVAPLLLLQRDSAPSPFTQPRDSE